MHRVVLSRLFFSYGSRNLPLARKAGSFHPIVCIGRRRGIASLSSWMPRFWNREDLAANVYPGAPGSDRNSRDLEVGGSVEIRNGENSVGESAAGVGVSGGELEDAAQGLLVGGSTGGGVDSSGLAEVVSIVGEEVTKDEKWYDLFVNGSLQVINVVNETTGFPWWGTIVCTTLLVRSAILPLTIYQMKVGERTRAIEPILRKKTDAVYEAVREGNRPKAMALQASLMEYRRKHGLGLRGIILGPIIQMPIFISFFVALRRLAASNPELTSGGFGWFKDLSVADPTYGLPLITCATMLVLLELNREANNANPMVKNVFRLLTVIFVPATSKLAAAIFMYWIPNNLFSGTLYMATRSPALRRLLGFRTLQPPEATGGALGSQKWVSQEAAAATYLRKVRSTMQTGDERKEKIILFKNRPVQKHVKGKKQGATHAETDSKVASA